MPPKFPNSSNTPDPRQATSIVPKVEYLSPKVSPEFVVAVAALLDKFGSLRHLTDKYSLTTFKVVSMPILQTLDREISANQDILEEGCAFLELVDQLSMFYTEPSERSYIQQAYDKMMGSRTPPANYSSAKSLKPEVMVEYFIQNTSDQDVFFQSNPFVFGLYLYVLFWTMTQFKAET